MNIFDYVSTEVFVFILLFMAIFALLLIAKPSKANRILTVFLIILAVGIYISYQSGNTTIIRWVNQTTQFLDRIIQFLNRTIQSIRALFK